MAQTEIPKIYDSTKVEDSIYKKWEESGFFNPDNLPDKRKDAFTISMPPPNATGILHIGHAVMLAIQDAVIRFQRMNGKKSLWLPGTDHAAIATQTKVEKLIREKERKTRHDLGREEFLKRVKKYVADSQNTIRNQIKKMGSSCDWSRERYTLDEGLTAAVNEAFIQMYNDGLIYRGNRIVNWCPHCASTLADDEVEHKEQRGKFYYIKYGPFTVATTRPETKIGDTAVAVNPKDERWQSYIGKELDVNLGKVDIHVKVIDDESVDPEFGTGAVGVTPAHSLVDFGMAEKNNLPVIQVIGPDGKMTDKAGHYAGMSVKECRERFVEDLKRAGLLEKIEEVDNNLSICYRCENSIEPLMSKQWFIDVNKPIERFGKRSIKERALEAVKDGEIEIIPDRFKKVYYHWLGDLRDWCVSRQIWFGHRIPVWYKIKKSRNQENPDARFAGSGSRLRPFSFTQGERRDKKTNDEEIFVGNKMGFAESVVPQVFNGKVKTYRLRDHGSSAGEKIIFENTQAGKIFGFGEILAVEKTTAEKINLNDPGHGATYKKREELIAAFKRYNPEKEVNGKSEVYIYTYKFTPVQEGEWEQDPDTLDTWFSSGLWTFSTLGWPEQTKDLKTFYPTSLMETGYDILFFWVARMIIMSTYLMEEIPFKQVYLHGLIRDEKGRKMSKSLGNVIDPLDMIKKYGADAARLSLMIGTTPGNDMNISEDKIAGFRNFINKLWNISRYILMNVKAVKLIEKQPKPKTLADEWILAELNKLIEFAGENLEKYNFSAVGEKIYEFTWSKLADWYVEASKIEGNKDEILLYVLQNLLKLWHPFTPFVTEEIWQKFGNKELLIVQKWPDTKGKVDQKAIKDFKLIEDIITAIRNLRSESKIPPAKRLKAVIISSKHAKLMEKQAEIIKDLARLGDLKVLAKGKKPAASLSAIVSGIEIYLPISGMMDIGKETKRLEEEVKRLEEFNIHIEEKLKNERFLERAPKEIIEVEREKLAMNREEVVKIKQQLKSLR